MNNSAQPLLSIIKVPYAATKALCAVTGAAVIAAAVLVVSGSGGQVKASATAFSDRFIVEAAGPACSARSWPYYEARCIRGHDGMHARPVRVITTDRLN